MQWVFCGCLVNEDDFVTNHRSFKLCSHSVTLIEFSFVGYTVYNTSWSAHPPPPGFLGLWNLLWQCCEILHSIKFEIVGVCVFGRSSRRGKAVCLRLSMSNPAFHKILRPANPFQDDI